jgi:hypothetical protein
VSRQRRERETWPPPAADEWMSGFALACRFPHSLRKALETAAAERKTSIAGYIEAILLEKLIRIGLVGTRRPDEGD